MKRLASGSALLLIATTLGIVTAAAAFAWLSGAEKEETQVQVAQERTRPGVVAAIEIPAGTRLTAAMLEVREVPEAAYLQGTSADLSLLVGRVTRYPVIPGEQMSAHKLVLDGEATGNGLAFSVPPGMRAVSVSINEVRGAGGLIVPGDRVDVMVHTDYERLFAPTELVSIVTSEEKRHPTTLTVLQDVLVLAVAQATTPPVDGQSDAASLRPEAAEAQPNAGSVTLAVTPTQAQTLFFASQEGTIGLVLRAFGDPHSTYLEPLLRLEPLGVVGGSLTRN
jgi:pilus assembly protein CpaB